LFPANQLIGFGAVKRAKLVVILKPDPMGKLPIQTVNADSHIKKAEKSNWLGCPAHFGSAAMSGVIPECAPKRTAVDSSEFMGPIPQVCISPKTACRITAGGFVVAVTSTRSWCPC
jgi:hypothetical protein